MADAKDESFSTSEEDVEALEKKGYCRTGDETPLLISLYQQNQELFKNVNYKKKQVWELIASRMKSSYGCNARADQCEGKWKALTLSFRKCEDHNNQTGSNRKECPFYHELSEVYGYRPNARSFATASSSGLGDSTRPPSNPSKNSDMDKENHAKEPELSTGRTAKRLPENSDETSPNKKTKRSSGPRQNDCLEWLKDFTEKRERENEERSEKLQKQNREKMHLLSGLLDVLKDLKK
ncbi:uncharacterized protein [Montipora capricornis]|uniref:uncharacterized protein n=1 Tax=Montipora capricornis TaxID=246305 RepID=UPI0035F11A6D